jgi:hypothetical protein
MGGSLKQEELIYIKNQGLPYNNIENFVESGTYKGDTAITASKEFKNVYTIEICESLYKNSMLRASNEGIHNIVFLLGDSLEQLKNIMPRVLSGAIFFIDAHISGADSGWNHINRVPLMEELKNILSYRIGPSVFIFDDLRLWKSKVWDWAHITNNSIAKKFFENNIEISHMFEKEDRFYVFTK